MGGNGNEVLASVMQTRDGGYIVGGSSLSGMITGERTDVRRGIGNDYWILKLDDRGAIEWQRTIGGYQANTLSNIQETSEGGYIVGGTSASDASGEKNETSWNATNDYWVLKLNDTGGIQWQKTIGGTGDDILTHIREVAPNEYILGGSSGSAQSGNKTEASRGGDYDYWIVKLHFECDTTARYASDSFCRTTPVSYILPGGGIASAPGIYRDTFTTVSGCDSVWVTTLSVYGPDTTVMQSGYTLTAQVRGAFYQWINCTDKQLVPGADNPSFTPEADGSYAVVVTTGGCSDTSGCHEVLVSNSIAQHLAGKVLRVYPNPVSSKLHVSAPIEVNIQIGSVDGRTVLRQQGATVDVSMLPEGLYMLQVTDCEGRLIHMEKLIKSGR
jgi:phenylpyruvate tautomerase PptA (4-oxalocrotonate tautomerase family)